MLRLFPTRDRAREILILSLPIIGGMLSFNLINLVDTAMIGALGDVALAAVGLAGFFYFLFMAVPIGVSAAIQTVVARRLGQDRLEELAVPLNTGLVLVGISSIPLTMLGWWIAPVLFELMGAESSVIAEGVPYFRWRIVGLLGIGVNIAFRGYWNGINRPMTYLKILLGTHVLNIVLNWVFIFGAFGVPAFGVSGAGIASALALTVGSVAYFVHGIWTLVPARFCHSFPRMSDVRDMVVLGGPVVIQQVFMSVYLLGFFWIVGQLGTTELAIGSVLVNLILAAILPGIGFGMTSLSLVSQSLGRGNVTEAREWAWDVVRVSGWVIFSAGAIGLIIPRAILGVFIRDPQTLEMAVAPFRIDCAVIWVIVVGQVLIHSLTGAGATRVVAVVSVILQWALALPVAYLFGPYLGYGLVGIWGGLVVYELAYTGIFAWIWERRGWADIRV